jgi:putative ABC transport system permease protein
MLDFAFNYAGRQDATVIFAEPRAASTIADIARLPGVVAVEPFRAVPARLRHGPAERREALTAVAPGATLNRLINDRWAPVEVPPHGLVLSTALAERLRASRGSRVLVDVLEGRRATLELEVVDVVRTYQGTPAYIDLGYLNRLLGDGELISGAYLKIDGSKAQALYRAVKQRPMIAGISFRSAVFENFEQQVSENIATFRFYNLSLAAIIVIGVVYNNARLSFSERARELASMRVLGYRRGEVSYVLMGELIVLTLISLPFGVGIGLAFAWYIAQSFSSDIYTIPFTVSLETIGFALTTVMLASLGAALLVRRRVDKLDLIGVLKSRD